MIRGWANFQQHIVAKEAFSCVDHEIWKSLWQWAKRRHPNKGKRWIKQRYFHSTGTRNWVFAVATGERFPDGNPILMTLRNAADTPIRRHQKIRMEANPFDPQWGVYFEARKAFKMHNPLKGRKRLIRLWLEQEGRCPTCQQSITQETGWHVHHIIRRMDGGKDGNANLVMVYPSCHSQIHAKGLNVVKPARASGL